MKEQRYFLSPTEIGSIFAEVQALGDKIKAMKKFAIVFLIFLTAKNVFGRVSDSGFVHPSKFSAIGEVIFFPDKSFESFGIQIEASVGRHLYLDYHLGLGSTSQGGLYIHAPLGAAGGAALFSAALETKGLGVIAILLCFVPEGISVNIPVGKKIEFIPYFHPLQCDYRIKEDSYGEEFNFSCDAGSRFLLKFPRSFFFQAHLGSKVLLNNGEWGLEGGASIGKFF